MIHLKSPGVMEIMGGGGAILAATHAALRAELRPGLTTADLDRVAEDFIRSHDGAVPAFKGLYGFPGAICISVNEEIVHGIPSRKRVLAEGDIVTFDIGVKFEGYYTDAAVTHPVGEVDAETRRLLDVTERSLMPGSRRRWWATTSATWASRSRA